MRDLLAEAKKSEPLNALEKRAVKEIKKYAVQRIMFCQVTGLILDLRTVKAVRVRLKGHEREHDLWLAPDYAKSEKWTRVADRFDFVKELTDKEIFQ